MIRLIIFSFFVVSALTGSSSELDSLMNMLDEEIQNKAKYDQNKKNRIEAIRSFIKRPGLDSLERYRYNKLLIGEYEKYSYDSTVLYIEENLKIAEDLGIQEFKNESLESLGTALSNVGRSKEAVDILAKVDTTILSTEEKIRYNKIQLKLFEDLCYYASTANPLAYYRSQYDHYRSELMNILPENHDNYLDIREKDLLDEGKLDECLIINQLRLDRTRIGEPRYALVTFQRALIYGAKSDAVQQKKYLILSAISDIKAAVKDNASMTILASILYNDGDIEKAYSYIQSAYEDAIKFNSIIRFEQISKTLAPITRSYQELSDHQKDRLELNILVISILGLVLLVTIFLIYRQVKRLSIARNELRSSLDELNISNEQLKQANQKQEKLYNDLSESNLVKEHYIASFLNIHSEYIDKIDTYQKLVKRMLMGRKFDQLIDQINSGQFVDAEIKSFYKTFDEAFLSIHPNFISQFNELLKEGEEIELAEGEILNTELRIFALIRLGVSDSSTISKVLRYSVNTIYNYRVKIKNKAKVDREEFEQMVLKIDAF
ncbi:MAG: hypothetical protein JXR10_08825 [Cyclobacteriaceae bacterium]